MDSLSIDLWAANLQQEVPSLEVWLAEVEHRVADAAARGAKIMVMPEFACAQWLGFAPADLPVAGHLAWLADLTGPAIDALIRIAASYDVALLPGTFPVAGKAQDGTPGFFNRAFFLTPEGVVHQQDKLSLTPLERMGAAGRTLAGDAVQVFVWRGMRIAMPVCLDAEYTALWTILGHANLDLVLIPAKTDMITGFSRVFVCAHARAIELQTVVCVTGAVGAPLTPWGTDTGVGGCAVYLPCDVSVSADGVWAVLPAQSAQDNTDLTLQAVSVPVAAVRAVRMGGAEAEDPPALWSAHHIELRQPAA